MDEKEPVNLTWGPALWSILHHCTERIGKTSSSYYSHQESMIWKRFLYHLQISLPCLKCRKHYKDYCIQYSIPENVTKENIRQWLYRLHSLVNERIQKVNIPYDDLEKIYSNEFTFKNLYDVLFSQAQAALSVKWTSYHDTSQFLEGLRKLQHMYGLV